MKRRIGFIAMVLIVWAVFMAENAVAQTKCKTVEVHMNGYWEDAGEVACGWAGYCGEGKLIGTFNGRLFVSGLDSDIQFPYGENHSQVYKGHATIETMHGEIFTTTMGIAYWETFWSGGVATNSESQAVTGGTGRYEGATGYILMTYEYSPPEWFPGTGEMAGQVCWPEE